MIGRDGWQAANPTGSYLAHEPDRITIHHTASLLSDNRSAPEHIRGHQRFHQRDRGWVDLAYHFIIDREGNVYEGRPVDVRGDTATTYDPTGHLLPCLEGDYDRQDPTPAQIDALVNLVAWMTVTHRIDPSRIGGHRDHADTSCPGDRVYELLDEVRDAVSARARQRVELEVVSGPAAVERVVEITG